MSDSENAPATDQPAEPAPATAEPSGPFWVRGSDGSERGSYATVELAQASKANVVKVHESDGIDFVVADPNGAVIS